MIISTSEIEKVLARLEEVIRGSSPKRGACRFCIELFPQDKYSIPSAKRNYS